MLLYAFRKKTTDVSIFTKSIQMQLLHAERLILGRTPSTHQFYLANMSEAHDLGVYFNDKYGQEWEVASAESAADKLILITLTPLWVNALHNPGHHLRVVPGEKMRKQKQLK